MRTCFLRISGKTSEYELDLRGRGHIAAGTTCRARSTRTFGSRPWLSVEICEKVDHIGGKQNQAGAVYVATVKHRMPGATPRDRTGNLFGAP